MLHVTADPVIHHFTGPKMYMYQDTYGWRDLVTARRAIHLITYTDHSHIPKADASLVVVLSQNGQDISKSNWSRLVFDIQ